MYLLRGGAQNCSHHRHHHHHHLGRMVTMAPCNRGARWWARRILDPPPLALECPGLGGGRSAHQRAASGGEHCRDSHTRYPQEWGGPGRRDAHCREPQHIIIIIWSPQKLSEVIIIIRSHHHQHQHHHQKKKPPIHQRGHAPHKRVCVPAATKDNREQAIHAGRWTEGQQTCECAAGATVPSLG